jgi:hypothetical protein
VFVTVGSTRLIRVTKERAAESVRTCGRLVHMVLMALTFFFIWTMRL